MTDIPVPAHLASYVRVLGPELAVDFFLTFGGAPIYLASRPQARSQVAALVGEEKARALAEHIGAGHVRVPTAKPWIARRLRAEGSSVAAIARRLHVSDVTVRSYLREADDRQGRLFG